jgi:hypothetical protein
MPWFALGAGFGGETPGRSRLTFVVGQSDLMMHYDITVNDDCEIRLSGDQTFDEAQANQQTVTRTGTICQEMRTQVPARRKAAVRGRTAPGPLLPFRAD